VRRRSGLLLLLLLPSLSHAGELSLYFLNNLAVQYEGTGFRERPAGWELKVKPQGVGQGLRWRQGRLQVQAWRNNPYYSWEDGNSAGAVERQTGQTRLSVQSLTADLRLPVSGRRWGMSAGLQAVTMRFDRKRTFFNGFPDPDSQERVSAGGVVLGLHGGNPGPRWWWDGEFLTGHFFWTQNALRSGGGSIRRDGFSYVMRIEGGWRSDRCRVGVGLLRQMFEVLVPGGKRLPAGSAASLPINKIDFESPFVSVSWIY
jgi:hypothetical protein